MRRLLIAVSFSFFACTSSSAADLVAQTGDASITHDAAAGTWSISAGGTTLTIAADLSRDFRLLGMMTASNTPWVVGSPPDTSVVVHGRRSPFGSRSAGFTYRDVTTSVNGKSLRLDAVFDVPASGLRLVRHYGVTSGSPTFETWTTYSATGRPVTLSDLNGFDFTVPAGTIHWVNGLLHDSADFADDDAFTQQQRTLAPGEHLAIGARGRSAEQTIPWFAIDGSADEFYAALAWSGAWSATIDRTGAGLALSVGLGSMTTTVTEKALDGPHAMFGVVPGGLAQATAALGMYEIQAVRNGRPIVPLVTYNTWFTYGTDLTEGRMRAAMDGAAALGAELFVMDAGWYRGAGASGSSDFDSGLGSWAADPDRFPNGIRPLTDYAHSLGLKFGIWVEPERVNLSLVGPGGADESWLAKDHGAYGSDTMALICLAGNTGRQWVVDRLTSLLDDVRPDYLKWDINMWINCDRAGHGHGAGDGNFDHVSALYQVLDQIRSRYPDMLIEVVSSRLDLGMLRYSDAVWMDDRTVPSAHVRHNVEGLSAVFPPAYLLSFVINDAAESLNGARDLPLYVRSRMVGALGLCFFVDVLSQDDRAAMAREIATYKTVRDTLSRATGSLLSPQASVDGPDWDVLQAASWDGSNALLYAFQVNSGVRQVNAKPVGLTPGVAYQVSSVDAGALGTADGSDLMTNGIDIIQSPATAAHLLIISAISAQ